MEGKLKHVQVDNEFEIDQQAIHKLPEALRIDLAASASACALNFSNGIEQRVHSDWCWAREFIDIVVEQVAALDPKLIPSMYSFGGVAIDSDFSHGHSSKAKKNPERDNAVPTPAVRDIDAQYLQTWRSQSMQTRCQAIRIILGSCIIRQQRYDARLRAFLIVFGEKLDVDRAIVACHEVVALHQIVSLVVRVKQDSTNQRDVEDAKHRKMKQWAKVGFASVVAGTALAVTGGLAAPAIAAGLGTVGTAIGVGGTAATIGGFITTAGGTALLTTIFGVRGATFVGYKVARVTASTLKVFHFELLPNQAIDDQQESHNKGQATSNIDSEVASEPLVGSSHDESATEERMESSTKEVPPGVDSKPKARASNLLFCVNGIMRDRKQVTQAWTATKPSKKNDSENLPDWLDTPLVSFNSEAYVLCWEPDDLVNLGHVISRIAFGQASSYVISNVLKKTALAALMAAVAVPAAIESAASWIDNPWAKVAANAEVAGQELARAIESQPGGHRPVTLVGYGVGARVVFIALLFLAKWNKYGIVENVYLIGAAISPSQKDWASAKGVVSGQFVNSYCSLDLVLGLVYRATSLKSVAGLSPVNQPGVKDVDLTPLGVTGHKDYYDNGKVVLDRLFYWLSRDSEMQGSQEQVDEVFTQISEVDSNGGIPSGDDSTVTLDDEVGNSATSSDGIQSNDNSASRTLSEASLEQVFGNVEESAEHDDNSGENDGKRVL